MYESRASHDDIMERLTALLGETAGRVIDQVVDLYEAGDKGGALHTIAEFDEQIGGWHGVFAFVLEKRRTYDMKDRPIFRPFRYIYCRLDHECPEFFTRDIVRDSCLHIEGILKASIRLTFWEKIQESANRLPMGSFLHRHKKELLRRVSAPLYETVLWLNDAVYIFDKHGFSQVVVETFEDEAEASLFDLDEALAIYFIARHCGQQLIEQLGLMPVVGSRYP